MAGHEVALTVLNAATLYLQKVPHQYPCSQQNLQNVLIMFLMINLSQEITYMCQGQ